MQYSSKKSVRALVLCGTLSMILSPAVFAEDSSPAATETKPVSETPAATRSASAEAAKPAMTEPQKSAAPAAKSPPPAAKSPPAQSAFVNSFLNPSANSSSVLQGRTKAKPAQVQRTTQRVSAPAFSYGTSQRSFGTYNYTGGNNNRFGGGFANNSGFQSGNNARGTVRPIAGTAPIRIDKPLNLSPLLIEQNALKRVQSFGK